MKYGCVNPAYCLALLAYAVIPQYSQGTLDAQVPCVKWCSICLYPT